MLERTAAGGVRPRDLRGQLRREGVAAKHDDQFGSEDHPTRAPTGAYCSAPRFSPAKSTSSIMTTKRNSTATAPT